MKTSKTPCVRTALVAVAVSILLLAGAQSQARAGSMTVIEGTGNFSSQVVRTTDTLSPPCVSPGSQDEIPLDDSWGRGRLQGRCGGGTIRGPGDRLFRCSRDLVQHRLHQDVAQQMEGPGKVELRNNLVIVETRR